MKFYEFITVTIIFVIALIGLLVGGQLNKVKELNNSYNENQYINNSGILLEFEEEDVQKIYPFNGAYPTNEIVYLSKLKNVDRNNMTNEFILRTAFAKVQKEDWAESYVAEGEPVKIDAKILEEYIKDVFGDVVFKHEDFSNKDLELDGATTMLYENKYDKKTNSYIINLEPGDGMGDSYAEGLKTTAIKYGDRIEIEVKPIYLDNMGQRKNKDGDYTFFYDIYASYNFKTKKFENKLVEKIESSIYKTTNAGKLEVIDEIKNINDEDLETYTLTYRLNGKTNRFEFESLKFKE